MRLKLSFEVVAGIVPGQVMPEYTKQFHLTSEQWDGGSGAGVLNFIKARNAAQEYANELQEQCLRGLTCNWTRIDFIYY